MKILNLIDTKKQHIFLAAALSGALLLFVLLSYKQFFLVDFKWAPLLFFLCIPATLIIGFLCLLKPSQNKKVQSIAPWVIAALMPFVTITMTECLNNIFVYNMYYHAFIYGYILDILLCAFIFGICGNIRASVITTNVIVYLLALANYYVKLFRGTPFLPIDFASVGTAKNVAGTYDYTPSYNVIVATILLVFIIVVALKYKTPKLKTPVKIIVRSSCVAVFATILIIFFTTDSFAKINLKPDFWNQTRGYKNDGVVLSFFLNLKYLYVSAPSGYDADKVDLIIDDYLEQNVIDTEEEDTTPSKTPDIICIMNESFADLSTVGDFETNIDYLPFYRSLTENTVKGNLITPVIGSGTSNTEFEFLTGCTMSFYPSGSNAYTLYIKDTMPSLVSTLTQSRYKNLAFHPYYENGWNRPNVYNYFGFSRFDSITSVIDPDILSSTNGAAKEIFIGAVNEFYGEKNNKLVRQYVSDECNFDYVIEQYKKRDKKSPFFLFNVTMQNHGSYGGTYSNFEEKVQVTSLENTYPKANQYLSLIKETDDAFKDLIKYFKRVNRPVIICMFGDHQPSIEQSFYEDILGKSRYSLTTAEEMELYSAPFIIWANYDIEEQYIEKLSSNYLSSLLMKTAGIEMPKYNQYLLQLSKTLPVITTAGYMDNNKTAYSWSEDSPYTALLENYKKVQYNYIFDVKHRSSTAFNVTQ